VDARQPMLAASERAGARGAGPKATRPGPAPAKLPWRTPPHPGHFLESRFLKPLAISQTELATALGVSRRRVNELVNGRRGITPDTAVRLAMFFRNDAAFWMHLQVAWDMRNAVRSVRAGKHAA
jgi:addiction module HigA family antidote